MTHSVISDEKICVICGSRINLHRHHVYGGTANRRLSEREGCWVYLCYEHHEGNTGVHNDAALSRALKQRTQIAWMEKNGTEEDFRAIFGRSWL